MIKYPFHKLLLYLLAKSKFERVEFARLLKENLSSIIFSSDEAYEYASKIVKSVPIPDTIYKGMDDISSWRIYNGRFKLENLHAAFDKEQFVDIVCDTDIRRKIDLMSISPVFRKIDIIREFPGIDPLYIGVYLDSFANFSEMENCNSYVARYIGDKFEQAAFKRVLSITSRTHLKVIIGIKSNLDPKSIIEKSLSQSDMIADNALIEDDKETLKEWIKLRVGIAEKLIKMGAGNRSDLDDLVDALQSEPDFKDPVIYKKEDLESEYIESKSTEPA